jgi:pyruvate/2-oxoglutarate dehydrogenase complex dihydrolipoamide dehydrogenase (E3) component
MAAHGGAFDLIVIGSGPAGRRAAVRVAKLEKSVRRKKTHSIRHIKPSL